MESKFYVVKGFLLVDLVISLSIGAFLLLLAYPSYSGWIADYKLLNHAQLLAENMAIARTEAIKRGHRVDLCKSSNLAQCGGIGWDQGWIMFVDANSDGLVDTDEVVLRREPGSRDAISVSGNMPVANYVSFTELGVARMANGALQMGTFALCRPGRRELHVVLANSGRVRIDKTAVMCP